MCLLGGGSVYRIIIVNTAPWSPVGPLTILAFLGQGDRANVLLK